MPPGPSVTLVSSVSVLPLLLVYIKLLCCPQFLLTKNTPRWHLFTLDRYIDDDDGPQWAVIWCEKEKCNPKLYPERPYLTQELHPGSSCWEACVLNTAPPCHYIQCMQWLCSCFYSQHSLTSKFPQMFLGFDVENWNQFNLFLPVRQNTGSFLGKAGCVNGTYRVLVPQGA